MSLKLATGKFAMGSLALALVLGACSAPPPGPTAVALAVSGTADMNGTSPAKVQVFYLNSSAKFQSADYFALSKNPAAVLGPDLVAVDEYLVSPGGAVQDAKSLAQPVTHVGVVVGFRDIATAGWRGLAPLKPNAQNAVSAAVAAASVAVTAN